MNKLFPTISVIVPVYNTKRYLPKCLDSIASQTFTDFEVLMIDDGSTDGSGEICEQYSRNDSRFITIHQSNQGVSVSRNNGLQRARGKYISFVDSDDYIHPQMLELLYKAIRQGDYDLAVACYQSVMVNEKIAPQQIISPCFKNISIHDAIIRLFGTAGEDMLYGSCCNKLYKKRLLGGISFSNIEMSEDLFFNMRVFCKASKAVGVEQVLYYYVQHGASAVHRLSIRKEEDRMNVLYKCLDFLSLGSDAEACCLLKLYKTLFSTRLRVSKEAYQKEAVAKIKEIHKLICKRFFNNRHIPYFKKILFMILYYAPLIYRFFISFCELKARK